MILPSGSFLNKGPTDLSISAGDNFKLPPPILKEGESNAFSKARSIPCLAAAVVSSSMPFLISASLATNLEVKPLTATLVIGSGTTAAAAAAGAFKALFLCVINFLR